MLRPAIVEVSLFEQKISAILDSLRESSQPQECLEASITRGFLRNPIPKLVKLNLELITTHALPLNYLNLAMV